MIVLEIKKTLFFCKNGATSLDEIKPYFFEHKVKYIQSFLALILLSDLF